MEKKIGVLGGTFNPIHLGHLVLAQDALEQFELDEVLLVPCAHPPHKTGGALIEARHRVAMLELAIEGDPRMEVSSLEIDRGGLSYTVDTARQLRASQPRAELFFIIGADTLAELHAWKDVYELLELCRFVTFQRPGYRGSDLRPGEIKLREPWPDRLLENVTRGHVVDISSSEIRRRVAEGMSIQYLVPSSVAMYLYEHGLYKT